MSSSASPEGTTQLSPAARKIPIIVVPDTMGTRLAEPGDGKLVWNPTGGGIFGSASGSWAGDPERLANVAAPLEPDTTNWPDGYSDAERAESIKDFSHLVPDYYDALCFALVEDLGEALLEEGCAPQLYVCGYDWRLKNEVAAGRLQALVATAREECNSEKVYLVCHGQGGLVARYFCRALGGEAAVRAVFLIGTPILGTPTTYARLKRGITGSDDGWENWFLTQYMGLSQSESKDLLRALPGLYQLLPTRLFTSQEIPSNEDGSRLWLEFDRAQSGYPYVCEPDDDAGSAPLEDCRSLFPAVYEDIYVGFGESVADRLDYVGFVEDALSFEERLTVEGKAYVHPRTYAIACGDLDTPAHVDVPVYGDVTREGEENVYSPKKSFWGNPLEVELEIAYGPGDSLVPALSACPSDELLSAPLAEFGASYPDICGVEHPDLPNDADVITRIKEEIARLVLEDEEVEDGEESSDGSVRLEFKSRYTSQTKPAGRDCYTTSEWVDASEFIFLVGQGRDITVRVASPAGASATWTVEPIGTHSGTIPTSTGTGNEFTFVPEVTHDERPTDASRVPNPAVQYRIKAVVDVHGVAENHEETITQDERDIIRQEFLDQRMWRDKFTLHVPYRTRIVETDRTDVRGNYTLILDSAISHLLEATEANLGLGAGSIKVSSGWRNPRRNLAAGSTVVNSNHQHGGAVDMQPANPGTGANRRHALLNLYNAALDVSDARTVLLEHNAKQLYQGKKAMPEPSSTDPDNDGDGLPDVATITYKSEPTRTYAELFDYATHVHIDKDPVDGGDDD
ncbi:MAG: hypothetical protein U0271_13645 [Polyangiaceae bacterium]